MYGRTRRRSRNPSRARVHMGAPVLIVHTSLPTAEEAVSLARVLVGEGLAACVQIVAIHSVFAWEGDIEAADEWRLEIKTAARHGAALTARIEALHPYDVPEIVAFPADVGQTYGRWVEAVTS